MEVLPPDAACPPVAGLLSETPTGIPQPAEATFFPHIACAIFRDRPELCDKFREVPGPLEPAVVIARSGITDGPQKQAGLAGHHAACGFVNYATWRRQRPRTVQSNESRC
jgi:hypothetical protein